jgi:RNA polymerase sigma-70 factor (ECF subfamily)
MTRDDLAPPDTATADEKVLLDDQQKFYEQVVASLSAKQKEIFHLREVEELAYQDIAEILSLSLSEVKVTLHRTRKQIKTEMEKIDSYGLAN